MSSSSRAPRQIPPPSGADAKAQMYARFIPREEVGSFAAWKLGALSDATPAAAPAAAPMAGEAVRSEAGEDFAEQLQRARQAGYQDGYRDGLIALEGFKQSFAQQTTVQVGQLVRSIGGQLDALQQQMAEALTATAVALARQVVRSELEHRPDAVVTVAAEALETLLLSARHLTLRVNPQDHALVAQGAGAELAARGARLVADAAQTRGGCLIESDIGVVDASIEARWRRAAAALGSSVPWSDGAPSDLDPSTP